MFTGWLQQVSSTCSVSRTEVSWWDLIPGVLRSSKNFHCKSSQNSSDMFQVSTFAANTCTLTGNVNAIVCGWSSSHPLSFACCFYVYVFVAVYKQLCVCSCLRVCLSAIWFILVVFVNCKKFCWHELSLAANLILAASVINRVNYPFYGSSQNNHDLCIPEFSFSISCFRPIFKRQTRILGRFLTKGHKLMKI